MDVKPRKEPRQTRARATVDAIVEATTQVLLQEGYERFTTVRAAERAGVSVGTLYQYFPNKAALVAAVIDRCCEDFVAAFRSAVADPPHARLADRIAALIDFALVSRHLPANLHRLVRDLAPHIGVAEKADSVSRTAAAIIESTLRQHAAEIAPEVDLETAATIIETVLEAITHRIVLAGLEESPHDRLASETTRLITRYLARSAAPD
jgi:AcrR family transcriptional regulator